MERLYRWTVLLIATLGGAGFAHAARIDVAPNYMNARVVAIDAVQRTMVIANGALEQKVELDDNIAGFGDVRVGDQVIVGLQAGPGWSRVSSLVKSAANRAPSPAPRATPVPVDSALAPAARSAFSTEVARLALQADSVDRLWNQFGTTCNFKPGVPRESSRGWFVIWEGAVNADLSSGFCRDLVNQIVSSGEPIKAGMNAAEDAARKSLLPGDVRELERPHRMVWDGWGLSAPKKLEP